MEVESPLGFPLRPVSLESNPPFKKGKKGALLGMTKFFSLACAVAILPLGLRP